MIIPRIGAVCGLMLGAILMASCAGVATRPSRTLEAACPAPAPQPGQPATTTTPIGAPSPQPAPLPLSPANNLKIAAWPDLPGWPDDSLADAFSAFLRSCTALKSRVDWQAPCSAASMLPARDQASLQQFFERAFKPHAVVNADRSAEGMVTGYYEPLLHGSRHAGPVFRYPVYGVPDDLLVLELGDVYPELKPLRLRGRLDGRRVVPYFTRSDIDAGKGALAGREILWVDDAVELFFMQVQGSGRVALDTGELVRVSYADQNGYPYRSIGRLLVERGELTLDQTSMQGIKVWAVRNPEKVPELLSNNASYVFFREQPSNGPGPNGALGVPLTPGRSVAVDPRVVPLGAPVFLSTTWPNSSQPLDRLMVAQDTGGAIKGAVRADFYWGSGDEAAAQAGHMRQTGRLWVLVPNGYAFATAQSPASNALQPAPGRASAAAPCAP